MKPSTIAERRGSEGPVHDPYSFHEITVTRQNGRVVTFHSGLGDWLSIQEPGYQPKRIMGGREASGHKMLELFEHWTGLSFDTANRTLLAIPGRRRNKHPCGAKYLNWEAGFPGERLLTCQKCGEILDSRFNRQEVE